MKKYKFRKYKKRYPRLFKKEKLKLMRVLPEDIKIEHIGSTAVPGLGGKGIIDIMVGSKENNLIKIKNRIIKSGYTFKIKGGEKNRLFFEKDTGLIFKQRYHIQLTKYNSLIWKKAIGFRDNLIKNKKVMENYSKIKKEAAKLSKNKGPLYRAYKNDFIKQNLSQKLIYQFFI